MRIIRALSIGLATSLLVASTPAAVAEVLENVPRDALGVVVVRNLSQVDARVAKLFETLGVPLPAPLTLLQSFAGLGAGLDTERDLSIVLLPSDNESQPFHAALWLPVADYDALVRSLEGDPQRQIAAVTIAGEDLLVARRGGWAVVMDPDQRGRLERSRAGRVADPPPSIAAWETWVSNNDVALVVLPAGIGTAWTHLAQKRRSGGQAAAPPEPDVDDLFGPPSGQASTDDYWVALMASCRSLLATTPQLERWIVEAGGVGCAVRLDQTGSAVIGLRIALPDEAVGSQASPPIELATVSPPRLYDGGEFVVVGSGRVAPRWSVLAVAPYVKSFSDELATNFGIALDDDGLLEFRRAAERAVADVHGIAVLARPGRAEEGVFTNNFLAVRVASDTGFVEHSAEAIRRWNEMFRQAGEALPLVFESRSVTVADRQGTEFSIDMAGAMVAALGVQAIPEFRRATEKLFGSGGKFRLQLVSVDEQTVLLAAATQEQAAEAVKLIGETAPESGPAAGGAELLVAQRLLTDPADWQVFFSPHNYIRWYQRQMDAVLGPVIGGPIVRDMPASPPIAAAGGLAEQTAWVEVALPVETLKTLSKYLRP